MNNSCFKQPIFYNLNLMSQLDDVSLFWKNMHFLSKNSYILSMFKSFWKDISRKTISFKQKKSFKSVLTRELNDSIYYDWPMKNPYFQLRVGKAQMYLLFLCIFPIVFDTTCRYLHISMSAFYLPSIKSKNKHLFLNKTMMIRKLG